jgi:hypothetical protein
MHLMNSRKLVQRILIAAILMPAGLATAQSVSPAELQFREALHKQQVEGDLTNAIRIYQDIVASKTADRGVKAKALLQLAACYEKLGRQSENVYQQIVRDFADQPAANQARAKLAVLKPPVSPPTITLRKIEMGEGIQNVVATDGQRVIYWDSTNTILYIGDVAGKDKRVIYQTQRPVRVEASRDLGTLFCFFPQSAQEPASYAVIKTDGTGFHTLTLNEKGEKLSAQPFIGLSWSWDSRYVLISYPRADGSHLLRISVADGAVQNMVARTTTPGVAELSPDGRFVAYLEAPLGSLGPIRIMPIEGGESHLISEQGWLAGWSRDGRRLMYGEVRSGSEALLVIPIQNGKPSGEPVIQRSSLGLAAPQSMLNGTMVLRVNGGGPGDRLFLATLDSQDRLSAWKPIELISTGSAFSSWSPDGREIVYSAARSTGGQVRVRNLISGADREVYRSERHVDTCLWGPSQSDRVLRGVHGNQHRDHGDIGGLRPG